MNLRQKVCSSNGAFVFLTNALLIFNVLVIGAGIPNVNACQAAGQISLAQWLIAGGVASLLVVVVSACSVLCMYDSTSKGEICCTAGSFVCLVGSLVFGVFFSVAWFFVGIFAMVAVQDTCPTAYPWLWQTAIVYEISLFVQLLAVFIVNIFQKKQIKEYSRV